MKNRWGKRKEIIVRFCKRHPFVTVIIILSFYHLIFINLVVKSIFYGWLLTSTDYLQLPLKKLDYFLEMDRGVNSILLVLKLPTEDINEMIKHSKRLIPDIYRGNELYNYMIIYNDGKIVFCTDSVKKKDSKERIPFPLSIVPSVGGEIEGITKFYECKPLELNVGEE